MLWEDKKSFITWSISCDKWFFIKRLGMGSLGFKDWLSMKGWWLWRLLWREIISTFWIVALCVIGTGSCFANFSFIWVCSQTLHFTVLSYGDRVEGVTKLCGILFSSLGVFKLSWSLRRKVDFVSSLFVVGLVEESGEDWGLRLRKYLIQNNSHFINILFFIDQCTAIYIYTNSYLVWMTLNLWILIN